MRKRRALPALAVLCACALTGCAARSEGSANVRAGMSALEKRDYEGALAGFQAALERGEDPVLTYRGQGIALMGMARYEQAAANFEEALSYADGKMPETVRDIRLYLGAARYRSGEMAEVITVCHELLEEDDLPEAHFLLGSACLSLGDLDEARREFDAAAALSPRDYTLYLQIYEQYEKNNRSATGDEYLQAALGIVPVETEDYYHIGQIYYYLEKYEEARSALLSPVEENYLPALELMGEIYLAQEDYAHAQAMYQALLRENGPSPLMYNGLAVCSIQAGDPDTALTYIEQGLALETEEGKQQLRFNEIVAYERKLDFAAALEKAEAYTALYPTDAAGAKELKFLSTRA